MGNVKEKIPMIIVGIIAILICIGAFYFLENYNEVYYTKIDNTKIKTVSATDNMKYEYTIDCYNQKGKKRELKFKTSRELKEGAYISLEVRAIGVHSWKEVGENELPQKVIENYNK